MENPEPVREHRELEKLAGHFAGPERMHPSHWNPEAKKGEAVTDARVALDGFAVVQDYEQRLDDGSRFAGHGVFRYDMPSDTYELHWFDSTGGPVRIFRGGFADRMLVLNAHAGDGWQRLTYDFNLANGYRFKLETSDDGNNWYLALEGDNLGGGVPRRRESDRVSARRPAARKTAARRKTGATKKAAAKKATGKKAASKKTAAKKAASKKTTAKKAASKKTTAKKATARKATGKKTAGKKAAARKASTKKTAAAKRQRVSALERDRRRGQASKKMASKKKARTSGSAERRAVSQKKTQAAAQEAPRIPALKKRSTRTGWHKTAAKGKREN